MLEALEVVGDGHDRPISEVSPHKIYLFDLIICYITP